MFKFIYFHFLGPVIVIVEEVNGEIFLKFRRTSIVSKALVNILPRKFPIV